ncbi:MAG TPA: dienelactone hydrolase family protein [Acidimicrobiales bacterium]|nr:dienelactone hydrolase family protein [Acidimicrobiales bacterium]
METRTTDIETPDGPMPLYEVVPDSPRGGVVVVQEVFGVNGHIQDVARRFAAEGYHAVAPHLFHRTGSPELEYDFSTTAPHMAALTDDRIVADVEAAVAHLGEAGWGAPRVGVVGFCFGGRVAFLVATVRPLGAAVSFYGGGIVTARTERFPAVVDRAGDLKAPWLGLFGDRDRSIPVEDVERLRSELARGPLGHEIVRYPEAGHAFHNDERPDNYEPEAAADAWRRTVAWLEAHLH